jgi:predicted hydrocarbon binding protein
MPPEKLKSPTSTAGEYSLMETLKTENGLLTLGAARVILMTDQAYTFLLRVIHEHAPHVVKYAFYDMGYRTSEQLMDVLAQRAQQPEQIFRYFVETYKQSGYGDIEVVSFDIEKPEAVLRGTNLFEAKVAQEAGIYRSPRTVDHYSRGMFAGVMSALTGKEVVCEEMACEHRGDGYCEFVILPFEG